MNLGLTGKKALVLASSKGLGKAVAMELAREGAEIMLNSRNEGPLARAAETVRALHGGKVHYAAGDVTRREDRQRVLAAAMEKLGQVDILVTNSGGPPPGSFEQHDEQAWEHAYRLLLESTVSMIRGVLPGMKARKWGRILTISSMAIKQPVAGLVLSNAVRSSLLGLVKTLSNELGPYRVTVNNVLPGYTRTERLESLMASNPNFGNAIQEVPLGRVAEPEEFAAAVAFLASERAGYITGVSLPVDGGWIRGV